ncbi:BCL2/adenovirus E1B 19 kDa protein-interacting protein 3 [Esox lucius]|uniref:BCL2 interacting protein 3 n=1 Tax=Esox lucius TaxID=8010 RepID=A0A3P9A3L7_ESOLU|nr:BCL2/adenovirus E1B 19 kDa protein-interacting protein 3 [Esox lucius]
MSGEKQRVTEENLQGSWVELHFNNGSSQGSPGDVAVGVVEDQAAGPGSAASVSIRGGHPTAGPSSILPGDLATGSPSIPAQGSELISGSGAVQGGADLERLLLDAQRESGRSSSRGSVPCDSPPRPQTPLHRWGSEVHSSGEKNSSQSEEDYLERRREIENLMKKNADWIWDWSSRPENVPRKEFVLKHPKRANPLSIRNTSVMKKGGIFSAEFLKVFLPSLFISHVLAIGLGVYIGRRLTTSVTSTI